MATMRVLKVVIEKDQMEDGREAFSVHCPDLPALSSWGFTYEEAFTNACEAVQAYIFSLVQRGKPIFL